MIRIERIPTGPLAVNTYCVYREGNGECVVVDPGNTARIERFLTTNSLNVAAILLTHGHFDHILGVAKLKEIYGADIYIHKNDAQCLYDDELNEARLAGTSVPACKADYFLEDKQHLTLAGVDFDVIATPGHTPGGVCFVIEKAKVILSGDTLFRLSVGRTDLARGSDSDLHDSIAYRLFALQGDYAVYPGHMRETTLNFERKHNIYMREYD